MQENAAGGTSREAPFPVRTCLWFDQDGEEAARFYVSLLPGSHVGDVFRPEPGGAALVVEFSLGGAPYMALNGGPRYRPTPAASILVPTPDQRETDRLWDALVGDGGEEGMCGWLTDRWGVSWQIVPRALPRLLIQSDRAASARVMAALMTMKRIDVAALEAAARAAPEPRSDGGSTAA